MGYSNLDACHVCRLILDLVEKVQLRRRKTLNRVNKRFEVLAGDGRAQSLKGTSNLNYESGCSIHIVTQLKQVNA